MKETIKIDEECKKLVTAMNKCAGIRTYYSCCGHGNDSFIVRFKAESLNAVYPILAASDGGMGGPSWACFVEKDDGASPKSCISFTLLSQKGVVGPTAYREAAIIAANIAKVLNNEELCAKYGLRWADKGAQLVFDFMHAEAAIM